MKVLMFRPFKRMKNEDLLNQIYHTFDELRQKKDHNQEYFHLCDQLIREAKQRELYCDKESLYHKILYKEQS